MGDRILLPGGDDEPFIAELAEHPAFVGEGETAGDHDYLCCGCRRVLFRRLVPDAKLRALAWRCRCGQINRFG